MPSLFARPRRTSAWLPNQVLFGIDCSDEDPKNWKQFGYMADEQAVKALKQNPKAPEASASGQR